MDPAKQRSDLSYYFSGFCIRGKAGTFSATKVMEQKLGSMNVFDGNLDNLHDERTGMHKFRVIFVVTVDEFQQKSLSSNKRLKIGHYHRRPSFFSISVPWSTIVYIVNICLMSGE